MIRAPVPLPAIAEEVELPSEAVDRLQAIGIRTAEDLLGIAYAHPEDVADELDIPVQAVPKLIEALRQHIPGEVLERLDSWYQEHTCFPLGAELGLPPKIGKIADYQIK